jgi:drug/metabolite transporter (DMT)-like permease
MRLRAAQMLVLANACWALSFPAMKALNYLQAPLLPGSSSWFIASMTISLRFGLAALLMLFLCAKTLRRITALEVWEGLGLGVFACAGLIFQMDGLAYTAASTSAFLTQFYCLLIPLLVAFRERRWPSGRVAASCAMVIAGVAVLSEINWREFHIGRGELETLIGSTIFTGQILWLQRPTFAANDVNHFTLVMFVVIAVLALPVMLATGGRSDDWLAAWHSTPALLLMGVLTVFCTLGGYGLMNRWQPWLTATQAGLLYCLEPVFASLFALFLPGWFSVFAGIHYPNERLGLSLLLGGGLITLANVWMQLGPTTSAGTQVSTRRRRDAEAQSGR